MTIDLTFVHTVIHLTFVHIFTYLRTYCRHLILYCQFNLTFYVKNKNKKSRKKREENSNKKSLKTKSHYI